MAYSRLLPWPPMAAALTVLALGALGCGDSAESLSADSLGDGPQNDTMPPWSGCDTDGETDTDGCATGTSGAGTEAPDNACASSDDCMGGICAASFDRTNEQVGSFACQFTCIPELDDNQWCRDDASCCEPNAMCTNRGYCVVGADSTTGDTDSTTGDTEGTGGGTGTDGDPGSTGATGG